MDNATLAELGVHIIKLCDLLNRGAVEIIGTFTDAGMLSSEDAYKLLRHVISCTPGQAV